MQTTTLPRKIMLVTPLRASFAGHVPVPAWTIFLAISL